MDYSSVCYLHLCNVAVWDSRDPSHQTLTLNSKSLNSSWAFKLKPNSLVHNPAKAHAVLIGRDEILNNPVVLMT